MRQIGSIEDLEHAARFGAYLVTQGVACTVDVTESRHLVWVHEEDQVARAKEELAKFRNEPDHERYRGVGRRAATVNQKRNQKSAAKRSRTVSLRDRWSRPAIEYCPGTFGLLAIMLIVAVLTSGDAAGHKEFLSRMVLSTDGTLSQVFSGEVWRLVSPIFLHFSFMGIPFIHFLFNFIILRDLGMRIEYRLGTPKFVGMVLTIAILSNLAQFVMAGGQFAASPVRNEFDDLLSRLAAVPGFTVAGMFGGMSGVNYGLFGYAWVRGRLDPESRIWVSPGTVTCMICWFLICMVIPRIANGAHLGGLMVGAAMGASKPLWKSLTGR